MARIFAICQGAVAAALIFAGMMLAGVVMNYTVQYGAHSWSKAIADTSLFALWLAGAAAIVGGFAWLAWLISKALDQ